MAEDDSQSQELATVRELCANGVCMRTTDVEAKLDEGNIHEAESSLREGLSLNFEVCCVFPSCQYIFFLFFFFSGDLKLEEFDFLEGSEGSFGKIRVSKRKCRRGTSGF